MIDPHHAADLIAQSLRGHSAPVALLAGGMKAIEIAADSAVQLRATARALAEVGVSARLWRPWEDEMGRANILHLFGSLPDHLPLVAAARRRGVAVVLSTASWLDGRTLGQTRALFRSLLPRWPSWRRRLYQAVDLLLPNAQAEAEQLMRYYGIAPARIHIVPNGADPRFAAADPELFRRQFGLSAFVLCCGRIEPQGRQLQFLRALGGLDLPIVMLGDASASHPAYYAACRRVAGEQVHFLPRLEQDDPLLASAYAACRCLMSADGFNLVPLEAALTGTPLVLSQRGTAVEYFGDLVEYVSLADPRAIRQAVRAAWERPRSSKLARHVREHFTWQAAARITQAAYQRVLDQTEPALSSP